MRKRMAKYGLAVSVAALTGALSMMPAAASSGSSSSSATGSGGMVGSLIMMVLLFAVMYFILIRPQKKKEKEQQAMQRAVRVGDEIVTIGGIVGLVTRVEDDTIQIRTGKGCCGRRSQGKERIQEKEEGRRRRRSEGLRIFQVHEEKGGKSEIGEPLFSSKGGCI